MSHKLRAFLWGCWWVCASPVLFSYWLAVLIVEGIKDATRRRE